MAFMPPPKVQSPKTVWFVSALLLLGVGLLFANCLSGSFVWDDEQFVLKNKFLTSPQFLPNLLTQNMVAGAGIKSNFYRPLQSLTHFLDLQIWGVQPFGHHLTNLLLHAAGTVALFHLVLQLFPLWPAAMATALFAFHPLQAEEVAYVSGRGDLLAILFLCLGLLAFRRHRWFSLLCAVFAMASKESMALFPLFLFLYHQAATSEASSEGPPSKPVPWKQYVPFVLLSGAYVIARLTVLNFNNTLNFYSQPNVLTEHFPFRVWTYLTTVPKGFLLWLWPMDLHHERSWSVYTSAAFPQVWLSLALVLELIGAAVWFWRRNRPISVGLAWFFAATIPTSNLIVLINALFYDHWFILPGIGLTIVVGALLSWLWKRAAAGIPRRAVAAAGFTALAFLALATVHYNRVWHSPVELYTHILSWEPRSAKICSNLGMAYADEGKLEQAITYYQRAVALDDEYPQTHHNLANAYLVLGNEEKAMEELKRAVELSPQFHHSWIQMGMIQLKRNHLEEAAASFERAIQAYPYEANAYLGLAQVRLAQGNRESSISTLEKGLQVLPNDPKLQLAAAGLRSSS